MTAHRALLVTLALPLLVLLADSRALLAATRYIELGPPEAFMPSQPYVEIELFSGSTGLGPYGDLWDLGIYPYNAFLLDTGANSILSVKAATTNFEPGYQPASGYHEYHEQGVAGVAVLDVSSQYRVEIRGSDGVPHNISPQTPNAVRILSTPDLEFGQEFPFTPPGVVGMPAMIGRVTSLDMTDPLLSGVLPTFAEGPNALPVGNGHRYSVALDTRITFDAADGLPPDAPPDAPLPVWAPVPFLTAVANFQGAAHPGDFLLDTGAQKSAISEELALAIGLDTDGDGDLRDESIGDVTVGGLGGLIDLPVVQIDKISLPTNEGVDLVWTDLEVAVMINADPYGPPVNLPFDGIFGMDLLDGNNFFFDPDTWEVTGDPYFQKTHLDFRNLLAGTGTMYLDLTPTMDLVRLAGDFSGDGFVGADDLDILRVHWGQTVTPRDLLSGDASGDGFVGADDLDVLRANWGQDLIPPGPVPEPAVWALLLAAILMLAPCKAATIGRALLTPRPTPPSSASAASSAARATDGAATNTAAAPDE